jgi:hypothetical protein
MVEPNIIKSKQATFAIHNQELQIPRKTGSSLSTVGASERDIAALQTLPKIEAICSKILMTLLHDATP